MFAFWFAKQDCKPNCFTALEQFLNIMKKAYEEGLWRTCHKKNQDLDFAKIYSNIEENDSNNENLIK